MEVLTIHEIVLSNMNQFICNSVKGKIVPVQINKEQLLNKLLNSYEELGMKFKLTIEVIEKNINREQISLYNAFIIQASKHFGNTFEEMEFLLMRFHPIAQGEDKKHKKPLKRWNTNDLNSFIDKASALLSEQGFQF